MNAQGKAQLSQLVCRLAEYYDRELTPNQIAMYVEDLSDLEPMELLQAVLTYRRDPRNTRFPLPGQLRAIIAPPETDDEQARVAAGRIATAIMRIGPYQWERARGYVGELGWAVVRAMGGWESIVIESGETEMGILQAQWRELARAMIGRAKRGELEAAPGLPEMSAGKRGLTSLGNILELVRPQT